MAWVNTRINKMDSSTKAIGRRISLMDMVNKFTPMEISSKGSSSMGQSMDKVATFLQMAASTKDPFITTLMMDRGQCYGPTGILILANGN